MQFTLPNSYPFTQVWDIRSTGNDPAKCVQSFQAHSDHVTDLDSSSALLVSCGRDKKVNMWDLRTLGCASSVSLPASVECLHMQPPILGLGLQDGTLQLLRHASPIQALSGHVDAVTAIAILPHPSPKGCVVFSASRDRTLRCWSADS